MGRTGRDENVPKNTDLEKKEMSLQLWKMKENPTKLLRIMGNSANVFIIKNLRDKFPLNRSKKQS